MGHKGKVNIDEYIEIAEILGKGEDGFCRINFTSLEYDTTDGKSVYKSLKEGKNEFNSLNLLHCFLRTKGTLMVH